MNNTIIALASAPLKQAIAIIRISGSKTFTLVNKVFNKNILNRKDNKIFGKVINKKTKEVIDEVVLICYNKPFSYTGEDVIEINCHGSMLIVNKIINLLLNISKDKDIRLATKGEFTKRAFLNGKIDILQAQAVNDLINANSNLSLNLAMNSLNGNNSKKLKELEGKILNLIAIISVNIDYPEYDDIENVTITKLLKECFFLKKELKDIYEKSQIAKKINDGIDIAIIGKPNVGKSTLLNALLNEERAIISDIAGTTRDVVMGKINISDITLNLIDTAGIRFTNDVIEQLGIKKSKEYLQKAQVILLVLDANKLLDEDDKALLELTKDKNRILVLNKVDLDIKIDIDKDSNEIVLISALNNDFKQLINKIKDLFLQNIDILTNDLILTNIQHQTLLNNIIKTINEAIKALENNIPVDMINIHFTEAWDYLQEINGKIIKDNLLDQMFSKFCLGK